MRKIDPGISSLFGNMSSGSVLGSFDFGDYASIKNGSYRKLVKSYYAGQKSPVKAETGKTEEETTAAKPNAVKKKTEDKTGLTQLKKESDELKTSAEALGKPAVWKKTDGSFDMEKIGGLVKKFAEDYNDVIDKASKVKSKEVTQAVDYMSSMTDTLSKALEKVGVTVGKDGRLSVDEDALKGADQRSVKALFSGNASYGMQIAGKADEISRAAVMNSSMYRGDGTSQSAMTGIFEQFI